MKFDLTKINSETESKFPPLHSKNSFNFHLEYTIQDILSFQHSDNLPVHIYTLGPRKELFLALSLYSGNYTKKPFKKGWYLYMDLHVNSKINITVETYRIGVYGNTAGNSFHTSGFLSGTLLNALDNEVPEKISLGGIVPVIPLKSYAENVLKSGKITIKLEGVIHSWKPYLEIIEDIEKKGEKEEGERLRNQMELFFQETKFGKPSYDRSMPANIFLEMQF